MSVFEVRRTTQRTNRTWRRGGGSLPNLQKMRRISLCAKHGTRHDCLKTFLGARVTGQQLTRQEKQCSYPPPPPPSEKIERVRFVSAKPLNQNTTDRHKRQKVHRKTIRRSMCQEPNSKKENRLQQHRAAYTINRRTKQAADVHVAWHGCGPIPHLDSDPLTHDESIPLNPRRQLPRLGRIKPTAGGNGAGDRHTSRSRLSLPWVFDLKPETTLSREQHARLLS